MRPGTLDGLIGQKKLLQEGGVLRKLILSGQIPSMILWGPPGIGKTTIAHIIAQELQCPFYKLSAINSGVKDIRTAIKKAEDSRFFNTASPILFIDEIHRFSKSQQDSLLGAVENGTVTLIGTTTENPSFEVNPALLSRMQVYKLERLEDEEIKQLIEKAIHTDAEFKHKDIEVLSYVALNRLSNGDARKALNLLEMAVQYQDNSKNGSIRLKDADFIHVSQSQILPYDKRGENHYDIISAFIKSIRGSDPQAAIYWLACMLEGGEDIKFITRRLIISAAEDIGLANPNALLMANQCASAVQFVGMPEARIILSEATIYLATSPKSNSAYNAINKALDYVRNHRNHPVPLHLRNAPTKLMKDAGYGKEYKYPHDYPQHYVAQEYLPKGMKKQFFYQPAENAAEQKIIANMQKMRSGASRNSMQKEEE